jgi:two-component system, cell cycle response regulator
VIAQAPARTRSSDKLKIPITPMHWVRVAFSLWPGVGAACALAVLVRGGFRSLESMGWPEGLALALLLPGFALALARRIRKGRARLPASLRDELEAGGGALVLAFALVTLGGPAWYPAIFLLAAFGVTFLSRTAALALMGSAILLDAAQNLPHAPASFALHTVFLALFGALYHLVLSARLRSAQAAEDNAVKKRLAEVEERARTFRLISSGAQNSLGGVKDHEKWLLAAVREVEGAVGSALEIAEVALKTHTCGVFLLTSDDRSLKLHDCRSQSDQVQREKFSAQEGVFGALLKRGMPLRLASASGVKGVTHYEPSGPEVKAVLAVPLTEPSGVARGVLVADRLDAAPFTDDDERLLAAIARDVLRAMEVERVMGYIRKNRDEKDRFFRAIEELNRATSPDQVFLAVLESARQIAPLDFCAVTLVAEEGGNRHHRIARMTGVTAQGRALEGNVFADNNGLVANVVRYGAPLPGREVSAMDRQVIFDADTQVRGLASLKIFPLVAGNRILGTLVAGSRKKGVFDGDALRMLEVIAMQAAQAVLRAQLYEQMETMATTDGLTGLVNHRTFQSRFDETLASARRYGRKASLLLTDIDHFKTVNDTYGHPTGDQVLKGVARILREKARDTDLVARYGGEEFAIVMPETDARGAQVIAERIREAVMAEVFQTEQGPLKVTLSVGITTFPDSTEDRQQLFDLADQCLYFAKRNGRNQSVTVAQMQAGRRLQAVEG